MDNRLGEMRVFISIVDLGSFSAAAHQLSMTPSTLSKLIQRLEQRLGVRLLERSTRRLALTAEGRIYYERSQLLLGELDEIEHSLMQGGRSASGTVRINASVSFGQRALEPILPGFLAAQPEICLHLSLSDEVVDLYLDQTDVAFRIGPLADSGLHARKIGVAQRLLVAAPAYLQQYGTPKTVEDLRGHQCLGFNFRRTLSIWPQKEPGKTIDHTIGERLLANNGETVRRMAIAGMGIAHLADFNIYTDICEGQLQEINLPNERGLEDVHAVYLGGRNTPHRIQCFLDYVLPRLENYMSNAHKALENHR